MDTIIVKVSALAEKLRDMEADEMDYVELSLTEAEDDLPAAVNLSAFKANFPDEWISYEEVEQAEF